MDLKTKYLTVTFEYCTPIPLYIVIDRGAFSYETKFDMLRSLGVRKNQQKG